MQDELSYVNLAGRTLSFVNQPDLYPVNRYQSLVLATASEFGAMLVATRRGCQLSELSAWEPCCGGGPVAVTLKSLGIGYVQATDINETALAACGANAARNGLAIDRLKTASMLDDGESRRYDLIACNPPCGVGQFTDSLDTDALQLAVRGGEDGMESTRMLLAHADSRLSPGGSLLLVVVSTGNVRRLAGWLDEMFPERWRTFPATPVAAPYAPSGDPKARTLTEEPLSFRPMIWSRPDGWYWRLTWIVEITTRLPFLPGSGHFSRPKSGFVLCPFGYDVSRDPALNEMLNEFSKDGFWLA